MKRANPRDDDEPEESGVLWAKPSKPSGEYRMMLNVHMINGAPCCDVLVTPWTLISAVKRTIRELKGYPTNIQILMIRGQVCENGRPVSHYTNTRHTVATLVLRGTSSDSLNDGNHPMNPPNDDARPAADDESPASPHPSDGS